MPSPHSSFAKGTIQTGHLQVLGETGLAEGVLVETAKVSQQQDYWKDSEIKKIGLFFLNSVYNLVNVFMDFMKGRRASLTKLHLTLKTRTPSIDKKETRKLSTLTLPCMAS